MLDVLWALALWTLGSVGLLAGVYHVAVAARVRRTMSPRPTLEQGLGAPEPAGGWPKVAIVVPAHNEAAIIGALARSIGELDYPDCCAVFALDRCDDDTAGVIRNALSLEQAGGLGVAFDIVEIDACPADWHGKPHAVHAGLTRSALTREADLLLFVDADTRFAPACLKAAVAIMRERELGLLSVLSTLDGQRWWERVAQPWAAFELMRKNPIDRVNRPVKPRGFANGQFLLFSRDAYERVGGHEAVKQHVLEDIALAKRCVKQGERIRLLLADGLFFCRMYHSWAAFKQGWKRIYTEAFRCRVRRLRQAGRRLALTSAAAPTLAVATSVLAVALHESANAPLLLRASAVGAIALSAFGLAAWVVSSAIVLRAQRVQLRWLALAPVGAALVAGLLLQSARDLRAGKRTRWAGREFVRREHRSARRVPSQRANPPDQR